MKKIILTLVAFSMLSLLSAKAQTGQKQGEAAWKPSRAVCDPYKAEKQAENSMKPAVKSLYNAGQSTEDKRVNAVKNIYCNPPVKTQATPGKATIAR